MKKLLILTLLLATSLTMQAQPQQPRQGHNKPAKAQQDRPSIEEFRLKQIEETLKLEGERLESFRVLYKEYSEAMKKSRPERKFDKEIELSDKEIEKNILNSFNESKQYIELQEKYYNRFKKILSPREIATMYEVEKRIRERAIYEQRRRKAESKQMAQHRPRR